MTDERKDLPPITAPNFLEKVREAVQVYLGNRGDKLDRGLTLRDLADAGIVNINARYLAGGGGATPVDGVGSAVSAGSEPDLTPPPMPSGFAANAAISNLLVECDSPTYTQGHGHSKSRLYGATWTSGTLPVFATAVCLTEFGGTVASYATNPATTWRLWLTWVTVDGIESTVPAGGTNGIEVTTGQDVAKLVAAMTGPGNPFTVLAVETVIDGVTFPAGTYSTKAFIQNLQVTTAKIADLAVDDAKIASLSAAKLTAGAIDTGDITSTATTVVDGIAYPSFTINASTGLATFNNAVVRGTVYATAGLIGGITIADTAVRAGQTAYNTGTGFYLGSNGAFSLGNSGGSRLTWDSATLSIVGALTATTISTASSKFSVSAEGVMVATSGYFSGVVSAGSVDFASSVGVTLPKYTAAGTYTITAPAKMTRMRVTLYGGGGGGRAGSNRSTNGSYQWVTDGNGNSNYVFVEGAVSYGGGAGGSQGARVVTTIVVSPGSTYTLVVGAGGAAGTSISDGPYYTAPAAPSGGTTYIAGYVSAAGGAGGSGYSGIQPLPYGYYPGGNGGGAGGGAGGTYAAGGAGSGDGAGGGGGYGTYAIYSNQIQANIGGPGAPGSAMIEFFDPDGVVLRAEMDTLKNELSAQGHILS